MSFLEKITDIPGQIGGWLDLGDRLFGASSSFEKNFDERMSKAKQYGIHPLAMLGVNNASGPAVPTFSEIGQNISQALSNDRKNQSEYIKSQTRLNDARANYFETMARNPQGGAVPSLNKSAPTTGVVSPDSTSINAPTAPGVQYQVNQVPLSSSMGAQAGPVPFALYGVNSAGSIYKVPTQQLQEGISEGSFFTQVQYNVGQFADYVQGYQTYLFPAVKQKFEQRLNEERKGILPYVNKGYEPRYNVLRGMWVIRPIGKEGSQFWDHKKLQNLGKNIYGPKTRRGLNWLRKGPDKNEHQLWNY